MTASITAPLAKGYSLVELMISLALGLVISASIIQVMVGNSGTERLNRALASSQENGRYIVARLRQDLLMAGMYDALSVNLDRSVDITEEELFVRSNPIILPGDFASRAALGSTQGADGAADKLVISLQHTSDCRGYSLGYLPNQEFYVVNEYFLDGDTLKCRGFDGRVLRGQRAAVGHNNHAAYTIADDVQQLQISYGITASNSAIPERFIDAGQLAAARLSGSSVVAVRIALVVKGDTELSLNSLPSFKLLNENSYTPQQQGLYKQFELTVTLRNVKNYTRSNA